MISTVPQVAEQPALHPWILARPIEDAEKLSSQAKMYNALSKISLAAIAAIAVSVLAVSLAAGATTGALPFILLGLILVTPGFAIGAHKFQAKGNHFQIAFDTMHMIARHFETIKNWQEPEIRAFLAQHKIAIPENVSLPRLLPLIARFMAKNTQALENARLADQLLTPDIDDRQIRLHSRRMGWQILEEQAIPSALEAAFILHILARPYLQSLPSDVYACVPKPFDERQFDRLYDSDDAYLILKNQNNELVMLDDLRKDLSADALHNALFAQIGSLSEIEAPSAWNTTGYAVHPLSQPRDR